MDSPNDKRTRRILDKYRRELLPRVKAWFDEIFGRHGHRMQCGLGCNKCCREGFFNISPLDARLLTEGMATLPERVRRGIQSRAKRCADLLKKAGMPLRKPYTLGGLTEARVDGILAEVGEVDCPALGPGGRCELYEYRPMTCRIHGAPLDDPETDKIEETCDLNSTLKDRGPWKRRMSALTDILLAEDELNRELLDLDEDDPLEPHETFIPLALLPAFARTRPPRAKRGDT